MWIVASAGVSDPRSAEYATHRGGARPSRVSYYFASHKHAPTGAVCPRSGSVESCRRGAGRPAPADAEGRIVEQRDPVRRDRRHLGGRAYPPVAPAGLLRSRLLIRLWRRRRRTRPWWIRSSTEEQAPAPLVRRRRPEAPATAPAPDRHLRRGARRLCPPRSPSPSAVRGEDREAPADPAHRRVLSARRRLLLMLVVLSIASGVLAVTRMAAWWVIVPPSVMLLGYLLLLRAAAQGRR